jgi:adenylate cyclase
MVAGGLPLAKRDHLERVADFAIELIQAVNDFNESEKTQIQVRIGMHCGPVVAGVIGRSKFTYDVWGDTVNFASRMESAGVGGRIHVVCSFSSSCDLSVLHTFYPSQLDILALYKLFNLLTTWH